MKEGRSKKTGIETPQRFPPKGRTEQEINEIGSAEIGGKHNF